MPQTVFISSRIDELKEERNNVEVGISELWNHEDIPFKVWDWGNAKEIPSGKSTDRIQSEGVRDSDIYVLILGSEYGNKEYGESPTHKEYDIACSELEKDCILIFIRKGGRIEEKLERWIEELKNKHTCKPFENPDQLKNLVKTRLRDLWSEEKWKANKVDADEKLPDIRVKVNLALVPDGQGGTKSFLSIEAQNHDKNSVFLSFPSFAIKGSGNKITVVRDSVYNLPVPTGELKPGDSRSILVDPTRFEIENLEQLGEVFFPDKIGRKFKGSEEDTLIAIKAVKNSEDSRARE